MTEEYTTNGQLLEVKIRCENVHHAIDANHNTKCPVVVSCRAQLAIMLRHLSRVG